MANDLLYGKMTMDHLTKRPSDARFTLAIVRHSERPSFDNVPVENQDNITITDRGVETARDFGRALVLDAGIKNLRVYHWGLRRCADTADAIAAGATAAGCTVRERNVMHLMSPIADQNAYRTALNLGQWYKLLHDWQATQEGHVAMVPVRKYTSEIFGKLLGNQLNSDETCIVAAHDLSIFPLASCIFGGEVNKIGYLEGIVMCKSGSESEILVSFDGKVRSVQLSDLQ